ncbi:MAG: hypothetical protein L3K15_04150 [Thermoplasmata archaeon]|nr:hypothetical protein [Thermoplasmata archaeon]
MRRTGFLAVPAVALLILLVVPAGSTAAGTSGTAKSCSAGLAYCTYTLGSGSLTGWAYTTPSSIAFRLPGEPNTTSGVPYSATVVNVSGHIDHVKGKFVATDVNTGKVLFGATDTYINVTQHCSHNGCGYTYALVNGTIVFHPSAYDGTSTAVSCTPSTFPAGNSTTCTAKVTDLANGAKVVAGNVTFSTYTSFYGTFSHHGICPLVQGSCSVVFTPADNTVGSAYMYAHYPVHGVFFKSQGSAGISVTGN